MDLMRVKGGITDDGLVVSSLLASSCGGAALPAQKSKPVLNQWCIAVTDHYAAQGYPTHFFCYNPETDQRIDPLDFPAVIEKNTYRITEYRPFTNVKLSMETWQEAAQRWAKENGIISTWGTPEDPLMIRVAAALKNFKERFVRS